MSSESLQRKLHQGIFFQIDVLYLSFTRQETTDTIEAVSFLTSQTSFTCQPFDYEKIKTGGRKMLLLKKRFVLFLTTDCLHKTDCNQKL